MARLFRTFLLHGSIVLAGAKYDAQVGQSAKNCPGRPLPPVAPVYVGSAPVLEASEAAPAALIQILTSLIAYCISDSNFMYSVIYTRYHPRAFLFFPRGLTDMVTLWHLERVLSGIAADGAPHAHRGNVGRDW